MSILYKLERKIMKEITRVDLDALIDIADRASRVHEAVRDQMLEPHPRKVPPLFSVAQIAALCDMDKKQMEYALEKRSDLPRGVLAEGKRKRAFSLKETREVVSALGTRQARTTGTKGITVACVNFKGGSTKTTTAFNLAQGLSLLGRKVLLFDLDPQGSATMLTGLMPAVEIREEDTASMLALLPRSEAPTNLDYAIRETYWDGMDIVPAAPLLYNAELLLPVMARDVSIEWWNIVNAALEKHRLDYDYIIIDTAPSLSYLVVNAILAADALLMPLPPENLDFSSSVSFWALVTETLASLSTHKGAVKSFSFVNILMSKVTSRAGSSQKRASSLVKAWIQKAYGGHVLPVEIPVSELSSLGAIQFGTVHDVKDESGFAKEGSVLRDSFDRLAKIIDDQVVACNFGGDIQ